MKSCNFLEKLYCTVDYQQYYDLICTNTGNSSIRCLKVTNRLSENKFGTKETPKHSICIASYLNIEKKLFTLSALKTSTIVNKC